MSARRAATWLHRYVGLGLAGFLTLTGLTGATIAWNGELERVFAPALFVLPPEAAARPQLDDFVLREAAARTVPGFAVNGIDFVRRADQPALFYVEARPGGPQPTANQIALDPSTGRVVGARHAGDLGEGVVNLMPFLYSLHYSLALGDTGGAILGVVALLWTIDCFVGGYLTFPAGQDRWWTRWRRSWAIRRARGFRLAFDLHRAGGLWIWAMQFVIAWSSVGFNLSQVYTPVMATLFGTVPDTALPPRDPAVPPRLDWRAAYASARGTMAAVARRDGFTVASQRLFYYDPATHAYAYRVRSDRDPGRTGNTQVTIDGDTGVLLAVRMPTGASAGTTITTWLGDLHTANVFGRPMQVLLTVVGLGVAMLSVTGVLIWLRKRRARAVHRARSA